MNKTLFGVLLVTLGAGLVFGTASASAWQMDPDSTDPVGFAMSVIGLPAPDPTIGDTDTTAIGVGTDAVGIDDSLTNPPPDPADKDSGHTYYVDNTPTDGDCPATPYTTIQAGVTASGPGDTVKVCPGTYQEQVRIMGHGHDKLKLESVKPLQAVIQWPQPLDSYPLALVDFNTVDHVTLRGFTITGPFAPTYDNTDRHEGVLVENAFDEHIHHNHITEIRDIRVLSRGDQEGDAVAIGRRTLGTQPGSARVDHNLIDTYQKNGVQVVNSGTFAHVDHNVITGPTAPNLAGPNGVVVIRGAAATVDHNVISNNQFMTGMPISSGVIVFQAPAGSSRVDHNRIVDNDNGIQTYVQQTGLEISHNDVLENVADGIVLCGDATQGCLGPLTGNVVRDNKLTDNGGSGLVLLNADSNLLKDNQIENNGTAIGDTTDGIRVDMNSMDNEILNNHMTNNAFHDCHDDSIGSGSGGTANTWNGDKGQTENRDGLCEGAVVTL